MKRLVYSEEELVILLKEKHVGAYNYLYENYAAALNGAILKVVISTDVSEELLQNVFLKIWKSIEAYDESKGRLYTWMFNIARNTAIDFTRSKEARISKETHRIDDHSNEVMHTNAINIDTIGVKEKISLLKEEYRILIDYVYFLGYTQEETAEKLSIPLGTVKTRIRAAINQLRKILN